MELVSSPHYFSHQGKVSCVVSIYKFTPPLGLPPVFIIYPNYAYKSEYKDIYIEKEEEVDNVIEANTKHLSLSVEEETNILNLLPEKYQVTTRIIKCEDTNVNWDVLLWNKLYNIF